MYDEDRRPDGCASVPPMLSITEILARIFKELDNAGRATAARVCRTWVDVALDVLWETLETAQPIMDLLGPFVFQDDGWDWETGFPDGDWARFAWYTKRVRSLSYDGRLYDDEEFIEEHLAEDVPAKLLYYVAANRGAYLLPQNQKLRWLASTDTDLEMILPFLSPTLREVDIEAQLAVAAPATHRLLHSLHAVLPSDIVSLRLVPNRQMGAEFDEEMESAISLRSNLRSLRIPRSPIVAAMLRPNLRVLEAEFNAAWNFDPHAFFYQLYDNCPLIEDLRILVPSNLMLTVESIRPLFRCSKLRSLDLESPCAVDLQDVHIREMGSAWRDMEALHICSRQTHVSPIPGRGTGTPISSLVTFAQAFSPKLRKLAIYIDSSHPPLPSDPLICFPNLEFFSVGTSQLGNSEEVLRKIAWFLSAILPPRIGYIHSNLRSYDSSRSVFELKEDNECTGNFAWDALSEMLEPYSQATPDEA